MIYLITNQTSLLQDVVKHCSIEECFNYLKYKEIISIDIETTRKYNKYLDIEGLDPYTSKIVMFQIGDEINQYIIDVRNTDISLLYPLLTDPSKIKVGQNLKFEYKHLLHNYGIRINNLYDTMIVEQILNCGYDLENSLEALNKRYLGKTVDKSTRLEFLNIQSKPYTQRQIEYGAEDILHPLLIRNFQLEKLEKQDLLPVVRLEMRFLPALAEIEYTGVHLNKDKWIKTYDNNLVEFHKLKKELDDYIIENYRDTKFIDPQLDLFSDDLKCNIQWTSSKQVIEFFKYLEICPKAVSKTTKKLSYTVEAKEVRLLLLDPLLESKKKEFVTLYIKFKEFEQTITTFGIKFFKHLNPITNRLHSNYRQILNTGRISSSGPNLQNIPSKPEFRYAFDALPGKKLINSDYTGQEKIILVNKSLDKDLLIFYDKNLGDIHSYTAKLVYKKELADIDLEDVKSKRKDLRQKVKASGFAIDYGGNGYTIAANLGISVEEGDEVYNAYFDAFPGLKDFFSKEREKSLKQGFILIDEITRRKFYFKDYNRLQEAKLYNDYKTANKLEGAMGRAAQNYVIQGTAGSITKLAIILIHEWLQENYLFNQIKIILLVHDEIVLEADEMLSDVAKNKLQELMELAGSYWCKRVPLKADAVVSDLWEH